MTAPEPPRAVFDCMVFLQAAANSTGPAAACLRLLDTGSITLFVSNDVLSEVQDVLSRPKVRQKNPLLTDETVAKLLDRLSRLATKKDAVPQHFSFPRDPKDEPYINLAIAASAKYLVTRDNDLLDLMLENPGGVDFRRRFPGLKILDPVLFLRELVETPQ
jgi:putative PIN family toxin of toxin-antitoxin system